MRRGEPGGAAKLVLAASFLSLCVVPVLLFQGFTAVFAWMSEGPSAAAREHSRHLYLAALAVAGAASLVGVVAGWWVRSTVSVVVMGSVLAGCVLIGVVLAVHQPEQQPPPYPYPCQENSGGDNRCPGD